jgi:aquaporin Z
MQQHAHLREHGPRGSRAVNHPAMPEARYDLPRRLLAEVLGTFALTFVAAGAPVIAAASHTAPDLVAMVVAPALLVMAMIYTVGGVSGAHFNPTVTLAFTLRRDFPWRWVPWYWAMQIAGATLAALLLRALFGLVAQVGATLPHHGAIASLIMETVLTFFLLTVILATATNHKLVGHNAALAVGGTIALDGLFAAPISGASMNPARSFGPALLDGHLADYWIYLAGPFAGALLAVGVAIVLRGGTTRYAMEAAVGDLDAPPVATMNAESGRTRREPA